MKRYQTLLVAVFLMLLTACGNGNTPFLQPPSANPQPTAIPTPTPDPCAEENMSTSIKPANDLMREFDDASELAANLSQEQVPTVITNMQRIRREVEDLDVPACLSNLKTHELAHMNAVIDTLVAFVGGASKDTLTKGITQARSEHDQYTLEMAHLLGLTLVPNANPTPTETSNP